MANGNTSGLSTTRKARTASPSGLRRGGRTTSGLPAGGVIPDDYHFEGDRGPVKLSELFAPGKDTLAVYSFMYGPERERSFLDGLDGAVEHIGQRINLTVVAKSPLRAPHGESDRQSCLIG
jgi:predicted dithiol-disulfide oxidoreductase (DUF899 family)